MRKMTRKLLLTTAFLACAANAQTGLLANEQVTKSGLSKQQAKQVLIVVLKHLKFKLTKEGMYIDDDLSDSHGNPIHPGYYDFALTYDTPKAAATDVLGTYSVNVLTGDVLDNTLCKRYSFPNLMRVQKEISKKTGVALLPKKAALQQMGC